MIRPSDRRTDSVGVRNRADRQIELEKVALLDGTLLEDVAPNADGAVTIVPHKLGRPWRGYLVTRQKFSGNEYFRINTSPVYLARTSVARVILIPHKVT